MLESNPVPPEPLSRLELNDHKAGMQGLDKEKINAVILEASKGSKFYANELEKEKQVNEKINAMMKQKETLTNEQISAAEKETDQYLAALEPSRRLDRTIVHIDMDAFYAAVEMRDDPSLRDKPMAVGSNSMLSTSNYAARRFGARAAMPGFIAKKLCPELIIIAPNFDKYRQISSEVRQILEAYDSDFCPMSLDEAYLDITEHLEWRFQSTDTERTFEIGGKSVVFGVSPDECVRELRSRIEERTQLTASAGIAANTLLAKICSEKNKPNGQFRLEPSIDAIMQLMNELSIRKINGIGKVSEKILIALNVNKCSDIYPNRGLIKLLLSESMFEFLMRISLGLGSTRVERDDERKSIGCERTVSEVGELAEMLSICRYLAKSVVDDMARESLLGKTVTVKLKTVEFAILTRAKTLSDYVCDFDSIYAAAKGLIEKEVASVVSKKLRIRLMGVRMSSLVNKNEVESRPTIKKFLTTSESDQPKEKLALTCPVCSKEDHYDDMDAFNRHLDVCLNQPIIQQLAQSETSQQAQQPSKSESEKPPVPKRRQKETKGLTLDKYFKKS